jgi:hypothetical protein
MLFLASAITLAVFTRIWFANPNQAWSQAQKDDRGTGAPSAAEPASEATRLCSAGERSAPEALLTADNRSMLARVPERIPTPTHEAVRESTPSPVPC